MAKSTQAIPQGYHTVTPSLAVSGAEKALDFYKKALGAQELMRFPAPDGTIMHAEIKIGDSRIMVNDVMQGSKGPQALGGSPASMWLYVQDSDQLFNRAVAEGAKVQMPMADQFWGDRAGSFADPSGYTWWIATRKEDLTPEETNQRAEAFFKQMAGASR
jgi:PhnB protein